MKQITFYIACLFFSFAAQAEKGPKAAGSKMMSSTKGSLQVKFHKTINVDKATDSLELQNDSVLVIFDRCDHTGAGVVYQVFHYNADHSITIPAIPEGKYFVTIQCLGVHRDRLETIVKIKSQKSETLKINQENSEIFTKDNVVIPAYRPDFTNMGIVKTK
jgi:hypothetical protein